MSEQILLQGKILGIEEFLLSRPGGATPARSNGEELLAGRSQWITLLCEVLPRALLAEFGLARVLLGSSGGGQFLLVLPGESRGPAEEFLAATARQIAELGGGYLKLLWGVTENLGDWSVVRKRLNEELQRKRATPLADRGAEAFQPFTSAAPMDVDAYFSKELGLNVREASVRRLVAGNAGHGASGRRQAHLESDHESVARKHYAGTARGAQRRWQVGGHRSHAGAPRARALTVGRAARRRG